MLPLLSSAVTEKPEFICVDAPDLQSIWLSEALAVSVVSERLQVFRMKRAKTAVILNTPALELADISEVFAMVLFPVLFLSVVGRHVPL